jgi:uncharacterized small protein (DUF1192 family)
LKNLDVTHVSLVDRAALRDPSNPDQPQKFLLFKKESGEPEGGKVTIDSINKRIAAVEREIEELEKARKARKARKKKRNPLDLDTDPTLEGTTRERTPDTGQPQRAVRAQSGPQAGGRLRKAEKEVAKIRKSGESQYDAMAEYMRSNRAFAQAVADGEFVEAVPLRPTPAAAPLTKADEASDTLERHAEKLRKSDPSLTPYDALVRASKERPDLVAAMR